MSTTNRDGIGSSFAEANDIDAASKRGESASGSQKTWFWNRKNQWIWGKGRYFVVECTYLLEP
jgi:hypothetical protein